MTGPFLRIIGRFKKYILFSAENQNLFSAFLFSFLPRLLKIHFLRFFPFFASIPDVQAEVPLVSYIKVSQKQKKAFFIYQITF